jgi:hypothetical protein
MCNNYLAHIQDEKLREKAVMRSENNIRQRGKCKKGAALHASLMAGEQIDRLAQVEEATAAGASRGRRRICVRDPLILVSEVPHHPQLCQDVL